MILTSRWQRCTPSPGIFPASLLYGRFSCNTPPKPLAILDEWTSDPSPHVRRLVSEGTRPRLPWGRRLPQFIADPTPTLALLDKLKDDESEYVRRSVANHLNDITKDNPAQVVATLQRWNKRESNQNIQWMTRHALRSWSKRATRRR
ncbi:MAG: DNA alkylation repair protein [Chloroflexi bacterium]|nr:DNA alkylation repair protein [Chloroflexota bacterium]